MNYIGIRGHRGAGKNLMSYLIGNTINYILEDNKEDYKQLYNSWCDDIISNENVIFEKSLDHVYFDSFGDTVRTFVALLLGCDSEYLYDDYYKDHIVVNLRDFSYKEYEEIPSDINIMTGNELYKEFSKLPSPVTMTKNIYMTLRDFILYFGQDVMMRFFGLNVWVKTLTASEGMFENLFTDKCYKLYRDIKTPSEVTYIKNKGGVIIKIQDDNKKKKKGGIDKLSRDTRFDYLITMEKDVYTMHHDIYKICKEIVEKDYGKED